MPKSSRRPPPGARSGNWWEHLTEPDPGAAYLHDLAGEVRHGQQVGEEVAAEMLAFYADHQPCPVCRRLVVDHSRRELRRCDNSRPDLQLIG